ncbi:hypothetical protein JHQ56_09245 [Paenarthrobacter ureafaciens]|nr:hypothetical protein JHQ56_09245 [Paenarthrobacter ureafaciens]
MRWHDASFKHLKSLTNNTNGSPDTAHRTVGTRAGNVPATMCMADRVFSNYAQHDVPPTVWAG